MVYTTEDIARTLKRAREAKGLSQRALSTKTGLTQSHISKIENASIDLQLSNLMELARALDLEVMLVPRRAVPAAHGLVRNIETAKQVPVDADKAVRRLQHMVEKLGAFYPDAKEIERLQNLAAAFQNLRLNAEQIQTIQNAAKEFQRVSEWIQKPKPPKIPSAVEIQRISETAKQLQNMRNAIVHAVPSENMNRILPAYRLDEEGSDG